MGRIQHYRAGKVQRNQPVLFFFKSVGKGALREGACLREASWWFIGSHVSSVSAKAQVGQVHH